MSSSASVAASTPSDAPRRRAESSASEYAAFESAVPKFSPALERTLAEVLPSEDPLDQTEFDPIQFINTTFPDESSLVGGKLDQFLINLRRRVTTLQEGITRDVREHSQSRTQTARAIQNASGNIKELFGKIALIKDKASQSEVMVQEICRDIRSLDTAKRHLTNTIRALRNLHMLVSAVGQLDVMVAEKQYRLAAERLRAIEDLFTLFEAYGDVPKIRSLRSSVDSTKQLMKEQLTAEFHRVLPSPLVAQEPQATLMSDACAVVDVLEPAFKNELFAWFTNLQLDEYGALFAPGKDGATIDQIERRYTWMKNLFRTYEQRYAKVFPSYWQLPVFLAKEFCRMSKIHISKLLAAQDKNKALSGGGAAAAAGKETSETQGMITALLATIEFEKFLNSKFRAVLAASASKSGEGEEKKSKELSALDYHSHDELSQEALVDQIKRKYAKKTESEKQAEEEKKKLEERAQANAIPSNLALQQPVADFIGSISEAFTPYMGGLIEMERKNMQELITKFEKEENWNNPDAANAANADGASSTNTTSSSGVNKTGSVQDRFGSSNDLFQYIKNSINRCSKLNKNVTLFNLTLEYRSALSSYANLLESHLPKKNEATALTPHEIVCACFIINTAEYINDTLPGLSDRLVSILDSPYKEQFDLSSLQEEFGILINKAVQVLVGGLWSKLNKILNTMIKMPWSTWNSVGDESAYVQQINLVFKEELPTISVKLSPKYLPFLHNQIASTFIPKYIESLYKCRRIGEMGAQQMSLDAHSLKNVLLMIPLLSHAASGGDKKNTGPPPTNKTYQKYVNTEMSKAEALLKTLVSPNERLIVTFKALLPKSNIDDLMRIMTLRGLKRNEQEMLVQNYNQTVGAEDQLKLKAERNDKFSNIFSQLQLSSRNS